MKKLSALLLIYSILFLHIITSEAEIGLDAKAGVPSQTKSLVFRS